jgi:hypothetical protein
MSEPIVNNNEPAPVEQSGLPSDAEPRLEAREAFSKFEDTDFNDKGLYKGRWNSPTEMADYIKNLEDKHSNLAREVKNNETQQQQEVNTQAEEIQTQQVQKDAILSLAPAFLENGMQLTPEMTAKLTEAGLTENDIKLGAYEYKEKFQQSYDVVGGKESYDAMMDWAVTGLDDAQKADFNRGLDSAHSKFAIEGLHARYLKGGEANAQTPDRIRGDVAQSAAVQPYANRRELFKDKTFADSNRATANDKKRYKARLAATSSEVYM